MTYLVITSVELEADNVNDAAKRALELQASGDVAVFVQPANAVTIAALESALMGATSI